MSECDIAGCDETAVVEILLSDTDGAKRCPACLEWDARNEGWIQ